MLLSCICATAVEILVPEHKLFAFDHIVVIMDALLGFPQIYRFVVHVAGLKVNE